MERGEGEVRMERGEGEVRVERGEGEVRMERGEGEVSTTHVRKLSPATPPPLPSPPLQRPASGGVL